MDNHNLSTPLTNMSSEAMPPKAQVNPAVYLTVYIPLTSCALGGNAIIILAISLNPSIRSPVFLLLLGLSVSDFLFALISPFHMRSVIYPGTWDLLAWGNPGCKAYYFLFRALYAFSVLTLVVIAFDRLWIMRMTRAIKRLEMRPKTCVFILVILSACVSSPLLLKVNIQVLGESAVYCNIQHWEDWIKVYYATVYCTLYIFPLLALTVVYSLIWSIVRTNCDTETLQQRAARRKKISNMLTLIVISFFFSWTPYSVLEAIMIFNYPQTPTGEFLAAMFYSMLGIFASGAVNPFLYGYFSKEMRSSIKRMFTFSFE